VRGTVNVNGSVSWNLQLVPVNSGTPTFLASGTGAVYSDVLMPNFDPSTVPDGFYNLQLTAVLPDGTSVEDNSVIVHLDANPRHKEIALPFGTDAYGIAMDPGGRFAYVSVANPYLVQGAANSYVFVIDTDPTSPTYNQVVEQIPIGLNKAPNGLRDI